MPAAARRSWMICTLGIVWHPVGQQQPTTRCPGGIPPNHRLSLPGLPRATRGARGRCPDLTLKVSAARTPRLMVKDIPGLCDHGHLG
jgi:hypothetical protein